MINSRTAKRKGLHSQDIGNFTKERSESKIEKRDKRECDNQSETQTLTRLVLIV